MPEAAPELESAEARETPAPASEPSSSKLGFRRSLLGLVPTVNAIVVTIQAVLIEPPFDTVFSPWVYVAANAAAVLAAAAMKITGIVLANIVARSGGTRESA